MTVEQLDRGTLSRTDVARQIADDIPAGSYVDLGIGHFCAHASAFPCSRTEGERACR